MYCIIFVVYKYGEKMKNIFIGLALISSILTFDSSECMRYDLTYRQSFADEEAKRIQEISLLDKGVDRQKTMRVAFYGGKEFGFGEALEFFVNAQQAFKTAVSAIPDSDNNARGGAVRDALIELYFSATKAKMTGLKNAADAVMREGNSGFGGKLDDFLSNDAKWGDKIVGGVELAKIGVLSDFLRTFLECIKADKTSVGGADDDDVRNYAYATFRKLGEMGDAASDDSIKACGVNIMRVLWVLADMINRPDEYHS
jgi:hypothetical protein